MDVSLSAVKFFSARSIESKAPGFQEARIFATFISFFFSFFFFNFLYFDWERPYILMSQLFHLPLSQPRDMIQHV